MTFNSLLRDYGLATYYAADGRFVRLLPTALRVARARLKYGVGPVPFSVFGFAHVAEADWNDYIVKKSQSDAALRAVNSDRMQRLACNKVLFYEHCQRVGLPTIPVVCRMGGTPDPLGDVVPHVVSADQLQASLQSAPRQLFAKSIDGSYGEGAFLIVRQDAGFAFVDRTGSASDLFAYIAERCAAHTGFLIQPRLRAHAQLQPLASASGLPTARIVTAMYSNGPSALFACLKIPVGKSITDNFAHGASGNLLAGIELGSGELTCARGSRYRGWPAIIEIDVHPDTGFRIAGAHLPFWREMVELALRGHRSLPDFRTIGWDVAATTDGVVLVEANATYDMDILQVAYQRGLKAELAAKLKAKAIAQGSAIMSTSAP